MFSCASWVLIPTGTMLRNKGERSIRWPHSCLTLLLFVVPYSLCDRPWDLRSGVLFVFFSQSQELSGNVFFSFSFFDRSLLISGQVSFSFFLKGTSCRVTHFSFSFLIVHFHSPYSIRKSFLPSSTFRTSHAAVVASVFPAPPPPPSRYMFIAQKV